MINLPTEIQFDPVAIYGNNIELLVARFDLIHLEISGNKLFKLWYFLQESLQANRKPILTFGGPFSNHLLAAAVACKGLGIPITAILKGDKEPQSHTLERCRALGMQFEFVPGHLYREISQDTSFSRPGTIVIPEGGFNPAGARGAALMMNYINPLNPDLVVTAAGTATTLAGIVLGKLPETKIATVPAIKNMQDISSRVALLTSNKHEEFEVWNDHHFGGYAKWNGELISFMNAFYESTGIPTDIIYTGKLFYSLEKQIAAGAIAEGTKIVVIHSGGLQGNFSLPKAVLSY